MAQKKKAKKKASPKVKSKPAAKKKAAPPIRKGPRQESLPGMEDRAISAIDDAALSYVEVRDQRIALQTGEDGERAKKQRLMDLMHAHKKKSYKHGNISIEIVPEGEKIKVKIKGEAMSDEPGDPGQRVEEEEVEDNEPAEQGEDENDEEFEEEGAELEVNTDDEG